jgi:hypothetical protein
MNKSEASPTVTNLLTPLSEVVYITIACYGDLKRGRTAAEETQMESGRKKLAQAPKSIKKGAF